MKYKEPLIEGKLISRYKRFFADVEYQNEKITIHVPNTGSLKGVIEKNPATPQKCWFSLHHDPTKKLKGTLEAIQTTTGAWVGVNTSNPNKIVQEAAQKKLLSHWQNWQNYKSEFKINDKSRLDGVFYNQPEDLTNPKAKKHFIEIKNTTYQMLKNKKSYAQFPDAVTERGQKHLEEMMALIKKGHTCEIIFAVQRTDVEIFSAAEQFDPDYAELLKKAINLGLIVSPMICSITRNEVYMSDQKLPVEI